jgi:4'-phosphopantetheinyl transferase
VTAARAVAGSHSEGARASPSTTAWIIRLDDGNDLVSDPYAPLSAAELARASRFVSDRARREYVATRAALRRLVSARLGISAGEVALERTALGKPYVVGAPLEICVSHSWPFAAVAVSSSGPVGIDVEHRTRARDVRRAVARVASERELAALEAAAGAEQALRIWTRKEAVLKAEGTGLAGSLSQLDTTAAIVRAPGGSAWRLVDLETAEVVGAIALGATETVRLVDLTAPDR